MGNVKIEIRNAVISDLFSITLLFYNTVVGVCANDYDDKQISTWADSAEDLEKWEDKLDNQYFIVALLQDKIVGFGSMQNGYLDLMYVHKDHQKQGIAKMILADLENKCLEENNQILKVNVSITAKPFFEKNNYKTLEPKQSVINGVALKSFEMSKELV